MTAPKSSSVTPLTNAVVNQLKGKYWRVTTAKLIEHAEGLERRVAAIEADGRRLDWLDAEKGRGANRVKYRVPLEQAHVWVEHDDDNPPTDDNVSHFYCDTIRDAIDAAMKDHP